MGQQHGGARHECLVFCLQQRATAEKSAHLPQVPRLDDARVPGQPGGGVVTPAGIGTTCTGATGVSGQAAIADEKTELCVPLKKIDETLALLESGQVFRARDALLELKRTAPECECWKHGHA